MWKGFQRKLDNFVDNNGGKAFLNTPIIHRADWEKIKLVLQGKKPVSDLGCK